MVKIAIIGGGLSGTAALIALVRELKTARVPNTEITIYDSQGQFGPGFPYHLQLDRHYLLAHEADDMGGLDVRIRNVGSKDFFRWIQNNIIELSNEYPEFDLANPKEYLPRQLYGRYLSTRYKEAKAEAINTAKQLGITINEVACGVEDVSRTKEGFALHLDDGKHTEDKCDKLVLANGHWQGRQRGFENTGHYFTFRHFLNGTPEELKDSKKTIVVQGTGQSACETALAILRESNAKVKMISRHGWLRAVRGKFQPYTLKYLTLNNLEKTADESGYFRLETVVNLLKKELETAYDQPIDWKDVFAPSNIAQNLRKNIQEAESGKELVWRSVLSSIDFRETIFQRLHPTDKQKFMEEYYSLFFSYQAPIPLPIAKQLMRAIDDGRLEILGGWQTIKWDKAKRKFSISLLNKKDAEGYPIYIQNPETSVRDEDITRIEADYLVPAKGQSRNPEACPILRQLMKKLLVKKSPFGGIMIDPKSHCVINERGVDLDIYAIGPASMGSQLLASNAAIFIRNAEEVATDIVAQIKAPGKYIRSGTEQSRLMR